MTYAALVLHMQKHYLESFPHDVQSRLVAGQRSVLERCAEYDIPVALIHSSHESEIFPVVGRNGTNYKLRQAASDIPRHVRIKQHGSSPFGEESLVRHLEAWGSDELILMGIYAEYCVWDAAREAKESGRYEVITSLDTIGFIDGSHERMGWYRENCDRLYTKSTELIAELDGVYGAR